MRAGCALPSTASTAVEVRRQRDRGLAIAGRAVDREPSLGEPETGDVGDQRRRVCPGESGCTRPTGSRKVILERHASCPRGMLRDAPAPGNEARGRCATMRAGGSKKTPGFRPGVE
ncbi:MAG: hypothetical protein MZV70_43070 [Desulfobacterales bacterium]|nr:hypothetical protein [Desulfobacterales bacterium]